LHKTQHILPTYLLYLSNHAGPCYTSNEINFMALYCFLGNEFVQWIRGAKERLGKCSEPTGDKESLSSKAAQLTVLQSELPDGQAKLEKALSVAAQACQLADSEDKDIIEEEVRMIVEWTQFRL